MADGICLTIADMTIDLIERRVVRAGRALRIAGKEFDLLVYLTWHRNRPVPRAELYAKVWRLRFDPGTDVLNVTVSRLRAKIDRDFAFPLIHRPEGGGAYYVAAAPIGPAQEVPHGGE